MATVPELRTGAPVPKVWIVMELLPIQAAHADASRLSTCTWPGSLLPVCRKISMSIWSCGWWVKLALNTFRKTAKV